MDKHSEILDNDNNAEMRDNYKNHSDNRYIVAGFPGTGKSTAAEWFPQEFIDMESSDYHWIHINGTGGKKINPEWPNNYIDRAKELNLIDDSTIK